MSSIGNVSNRHRHRPLDALEGVDVSSKKTAKAPESIALEKTLAAWSERTTADRMGAALGPRVAMAVVGPEGSTRTTGILAAENKRSASPPDVDGKLKGLSGRAKRFGNKDAALTDDEVTNVRTNLEAARKASAKGDYAAAAEAYEALGFPVDDLDNISTAQEDKLVATGVTIGSLTATVEDGATSFSAIELGRHGDQRMNDLDGMAANAKMMAAMEAEGMTGLSNPPTEAQQKAYMQAVAAKDPQDADAILDAAQMLVDGTQVHYSSAGRTKDPKWKGEQNTVDDWADMAQHGEHAGRTVGDCESKCFQYLELLKEAGFEVKGTIVAEHGNSGHMMGVVKGPDGEAYLTSNETHAHIPAGATDGKLTNGDVDRAARQEIRRVYGRTDEDKLSDFDFVSGAGSDSSSMVRAQENRQQGNDDALF